MNALPKKLEYVQHELMRAFEWMGKATQEMQDGEIPSAVYCMTVAMQHWIRTQHDYDTYITDEEAEKINWKFFTRKAMAMAKEELRKTEA